MHAYNVKNNETCWLVMIGGDRLNKGTPKPSGTYANQSQLVSLANNDIL
jgi:hypothetical protein